MPFTKTALKKMKKDELVALVMKMEEEREEKDTTIHNIKKFWLDEDDENFSVAGAIVAMEDSVKDLDNAEGQNEIDKEEIEKLKEENERWAGVMLVATQKIQRKKDDLEEENAKLRKAIYHLDNVVVKELYLSIEELKDRNDDLEDYYCDREEKLKEELEEKEKEVSLINSEEMENEEKIEKLKKYETMIHNVWSDLYWADKGGCEVSFKDVSNSCDYYENEEFVKAEVVDDSEDEEVEEENKKLKERLEEAGESLDNTGYEWVEDWRNLPKDDKENQALKDALEQAEEMLENAGYKWDEEQEWYSCD